jgi:glycosyltransferase involved in cell wall biosynthesis
MKVLIVNNMAPFIWGGAEELAVHLKKNIILAGHEAEILRIPFQYEPSCIILSQILMVRAFELTNVDRVIALKFPAYLIRHPHKTLWLLHQYRQAYDLFDVGQTNLSAKEDDVELRAVITNADKEAFSESRRIFTISEITQMRLKKYNNFNAQILVPPINDPELFHGGESGDYIFVAGRINSMKRQHLLLEALSFVDRKVKLVIAGPPDTKKDGDKLKKLIDKYDLHDRVRLDLRFLPRTVYADYINKAAAVAYLPFDEDCMGYVALEAATAAKALMTTSDSGGVLKLVKDNETGWVAEPTSESLGRAMNLIFENSARAVQYGLAARECWDNMNITWPGTIEALLK